MRETLHIEYVCTEAERKEAKELDIHKKLGGGSKWLTWLVLIVFCVLLYLRMRQEIPTVYQPFFIAGVVLIWFFLKYLQHRARPESGTTKIEVSENEITIIGPGKVTCPWSAFNDCLESSNLFVLRDRPKAFLIILPKRAFPDENSQNWFRELANRRRDPVSPPSIEAPVAAKSIFSTQITLKFRLRYRDYLDRFLTSWRIRGVFMLVWAALLGSWAYFAINPPADAVVSSTKMLFVFVLPMMLLMPFVMMLMLTVAVWFSRKRYMSAREIALFEDSISFSEEISSGVVPLTAYKYYKETRRGFILWNPRGSLWLLLPKRAFASTDDVQSCRAILARNLRRSRWFFG